MSGENTLGMSPAMFHQIDGVEAWHVTSRGAEAIFRAPSLAEAARLLPAIIDEAERAELSPDVDLRPEAVAVRVGFVGSALPSGLATFAPAVSRAAEEAGLRPDPSAIQAVDLYVAEHSASTNRPFWSAVLGYVPSGDTDAVDPLRRGPLLAFNPIRDDRPGRGRTHVDLHVSAEVALERVRAGLAAGGRLADESHAPAWWTLASPDNHGVDVATWVDTWDGA
jgi:4a-hydroxytetrahydrobiopterin dehydratase